MVWPTFLAQRFDRKNYIFDSNRRAVVKSGFGSQREDDPRTIRRNLNAFGDEAIQRECLVPVSFEKAFKDQMPARGGRALDYEWVDAVEAAGGPKAKRAAFRRVRIYIVKMSKPTLVLWSTVHCQAMLRTLGLCIRDDHNRQRKKANQCG